MIRRVTVRNFKRFEEQVFDLSDSVVLAGANDCGKTTLLQAISTWRFGLDRWLAHRRRNGARTRTGVSLTRTQFTPVPVREMNLLWTRRSVLFRPGQPRRIEIDIEGGTALDPWTCGMEFQYQSPEVLYARPLGAREMNDDQVKSFPPDGARDLAVIHVPALAGIAREEPRHDRGMQDLFVGQGRPGEILRNLLLEVSRTPDDWAALKVDIEPIVGMQLLEPIYAPADAHIVCEFRIPGHRRPLDLSSAGTGALQVILLLAFLHARRGSVILMDEPDAHQHVIRQKQVIQRIREVVSRRGGQLVTTTHSEAVLDDTEPSEILRLFGAGPRPLGSKQERTRLVGALRQLEVPEVPEPTVTRPRRTK